MRRILCILLSLICIFSLVSCTSSVKTEIPNDIAVEDNESVKVSDDVVSKVPVDSVNLFADIGDDVYIYYSDIDYNVYKRKVTLIENTYANLVLSASKEIGVSEPMLKGVGHDEETNSVTVNFSSDSPVLHTGTAGETQILQTIALSLILGADVESVYYQVEGEIYSSGHYSFEPDGFYLSKDILLTNWFSLFVSEVKEVTE